MVALVAACLIAAGASACGDDDNGSDEDIPTAPAATPEFEGEPDTATYLNRVNLLEDGTFSAILVSIQPTPDTAMTAEAIARAAGSAFLAVENIKSSEVPEAAKPAHDDLISELEQLQQTLQDGAEEVKSSGKGGPDDNFYSSLEEDVQRRIDAANEAIAAINEAAG